MGLIIARWIDLHIIRCSNCLLCLQYPRDEARAGPPAPVPRALVCRKSCDCPEDLVCDPETQRCVKGCSAGLMGQLCDLGKCTDLRSLPTHWVNCFPVCPPRFYGVGCRRRCQCPENAVCRPDTGECICLPGYRGKSCSLSKKIFYLLS